MYHIDIKTDDFGDRYLSYLDVQMNIHGEVVDITEYIARKEINGWVICRHEPFKVTRAYIYTPDMIWDSIEPFPNMTQAFKFMRENAGNLC